MSAVVETRKPRPADGRAAGPGGGARLGRCNGREAFTLPELLVSISIITFLAMILLVMLARVREDARQSRTKSQIAKINELLLERWESYRTRPVPVVPPALPGQSVSTVALLRLNAIRELMRMELPDRRSDVQDDPVDLDPGPSTVVLPVPSLTQAYRRRIDRLDSSDPLDGVPVAADYAAWTVTHQGAECLFMILAAMQDEAGNGLDFFKESEIGDVDGDGMREVLDAWGNPIEFVRWPAGLRSPLQNGNGVESPDPFDPLYVDPRHRGADAVWGTANGGASSNGDDDDNGLVNDFEERGWAGSDDNVNYAIYPLVFSAGPDKQYDIVTDIGNVAAPDPGDIVDPTQVATPQFQYSTTASTPASTLPNDPYVAAAFAGPPVVRVQLGARMNFPDLAVVRLGYRDNIDNHLLGLDE